jgi:ribosomal protein L29
MPSMGENISKPAKPELLELKLEFKLNGNNNTPTIIAGVRKTIATALPKRFLFI